MKVTFFIRSKKTHAKIRIRMTDGRDVVCNASTDIMIETEWWDDKKEKLKAHAPALRKKDVENKLTDLEKLIYDRYMSDKQSLVIDSNWLEDVIKPIPIPVPKPVERQPLFFDYWEPFLRSKKISDNRRYAYNSVKKKLENYGAIFSPITSQLTADIVYSVETFLLHEIDYVKKYPEIYKKQKVGERGQNYINDVLKKIKTYTGWMRDKGYIAYNPFNPYDVKIEACIYADPFAHSLEELEYIADAPVPDKVPKYLEKARDMYVLHCYIGARVSDFVKRRRDEVQDGVLSYIAGKTIKENQKTIYVPLSTRALKIIEKYNEPVRLFPFMNIEGQDGYNKSIKLLLKHLEINRKVRMIDSVTREQYMAPLCEVASSHTARKTFTSTVFNKTKDRMITSSMTGLSENSNAFKRYAKVQIETLQDVIKDVFN